MFLRREPLPTRRIPWVTYTLVMVNVLVYVAGLIPTQTQVAASTRQITQHDVWQSEYGAIPCEITGRCANQGAVVVVDGGILDPQPRSLRAEVDDQPAWLTLVTSMFLHGGLLHLLANMLFLWVFGNNVEDAMHPLGFLCFYVAAGMAACLAQVLIVPSATMPIVGASGAIAAVLGSYLFLYPRARELWLPAWTIIGGWAVLQFVATWQSIFAPGALDGGQASMAHFAGFAIGLATVQFFAQDRNPHYEEMYGRG